jgi:YD repeat-containing protein
MTKAATGAVNITTTAAISARTARTIGPLQNRRGQTGLRRGARCLAGRGGRRHGNHATIQDHRHSLGLPASKEVPAVTGYTSAADRTTTYTYDERGRLVTQTDPGGVTLTNTYDALDDLTARSGTGADATTADRHFAYSLNRHLVASAVGATWEHYDTNALGDILTTSGQAGSSSFTYNADESPLTRTDASGTSSYTYDTDGRLYTDTDAATGATLTLRVPKTPSIACDVQVLTNGRWLLDKGVKLIDRAAATALPRRVEHVRLHSAAADERC